MQTDGGDKVHGGWNAEENIRRSCMLLFFGGRIVTILVTSVSSQHFLFPDSISWEFSDLRCTSQDIFHSSAIQTLVSLFSNNWSVGWSGRPASRYHSLDVSCSWTVDTLSICMGSSLHLSVWIIFNVFVDNGSHERGQTSRPVVGAEIQTNCNSEAHICHFRIAQWFGRIIISSCLIISIASFAKIFFALRRHQAQIQDHVQQQPSQLNALNMARYRKAVCTVDTASITCLLRTS